MRDALVSGVPPDFQMMAMAPIGHAQIPPDFHAIRND
jgi:hypothetical protein